MPQFSLILVVAVWFCLVSLSAVADAEQNLDAAREIHLPSVPFSYSKQNLPKHLRAVADKFDNTPKDNPVTDDGATLGRVLFYDQTLSANGSTSCASCHKQQLAFTDEKRLSVGFDGNEVTRNSMSLVNLRYYPRGRMFWDERASSLEEQVLMPIENKVEMGHSLPTLVQQLKSDPIYPPLFEKAFGDENVTTERISRALAQFVRSIVSFESKYDVGRAQVKSLLAPFPNFTEQENYGKEQFFGRAKCASCHLENHPDNDDRVTQTQTAFFYVMQPAANGIDVGENSDDLGLAKHTKKREDAGKFKVPSLRNVELTAPYMHDGRFRTLNQVVEHYNWSVRPHPNLDPRLADFAANGMALPEREKVALTKFLLTLTDQNLLTDQKYSDPFNTASD